MHYIQCPSCATRFPSSISSKNWPSSPFSKPIEVLHMLSAEEFGTLNAGSPELCSKFMTGPDWAAVGPAAACGPCSSCWWGCMCDGFVWGCCGDMMKDDKSPLGVAGAEKLVLDIRDGPWSRARLRAGPVIGGVFRPGAQRI